MKLWVLILHSSSCGVPPCDSDVKHNAHRTHLDSNVTTDPVHPISVEAMPIHIRSTLKRACEQALVRSGAASLFTSLSRRRGAILAYHNIVPDGYPDIGDSPLHLPISRFRDQVDRLLEDHDPVSLQTILDHPEDRKQPKPWIAFTFDDAYRGAVRLGVRELVQRGVPATIFVTPAFVGGGPFWWDSVRNGSAVGVPAEMRGYALAELGGDDARIRRWAIGRGLRLEALPEDGRCATLDSLSAAVRHPEVTLAPHGWSHRNLTCLPDEELRSELVRPLAWLNERFSTVRPWLAYPYGLFDARVQEACARAGYTGAFGVGTGALPARTQNPFGLPRVSVPSGISLEGLLLRVQGVVPG